MATYFSSEYFGLNSIRNKTESPYGTGWQNFQISKFAGMLLQKVSPKIEVKLRTMEGAGVGSQVSPLASSIERQEEGRGGCMSGSVTPRLPKLYRGRPLAWENKFHARPEAP